MLFIGENLTMDAIHNLPRPEFVARHPWTIINQHGQFISRWGSLECAARTLTNGQNRTAVLWKVVNDRTGEEFDFWACAGLVKRLPAPREF